MNNADYFPDGTPRWAPERLSLGLSIQDAEPVPVSELARATPPALQKLAGQIEAALRDPALIEAAKEGMEMTKTTDAVPIAQDPGRLAQGAGTPAQGKPSAQGTGKLSPRGRELLLAFHREVTKALDAMLAAINASSGGEAGPDDLDLAHRASLNAEGDPIPAAQVHAADSASGARARPRGLAKLWNWARPSRGSLEEDLARVRGIDPLTGRPTR